MAQRLASIEGKLNLNRLAPLLLLAITLVGAGLRLFEISSKGLWLGEAFSVWVGWQRLPDLFAWLLKVYKHPPLYYTLLHLAVELRDAAGQLLGQNAFEFAVRPEEQQ